MEVHVIEEFDPKKWNAQAPNPMVSWEWGEARKEMGIEVLRLGEFEGDTLKNVFQITYHRIPHTPYLVGYMPRTVIPTDEVLDVLRKQSEMRNAIFVKMEPYVTEKEGITTDFRIATRESVHPLFTKWTQVLDLTKSEADLLAGMKPKWRYNIKLAEKKGVTVEEDTTLEGFEKFSQLYFQTTKRQKYSGHTRDYHRTVFDHLKDTQSHIMIASYEGKPLSAYHLFMFGDTMYYTYGGSSTEHRNLMASNLLMWESIKRARELGATKFDMWGSLPPDFDRNAGGWAGFSRFKEGFGTEFVEFVGSYDFVLSSVMYRVYNVADVLRKKFVL